MIPVFLMLASRIRLELADLERTVDRVHAAWTAAGRLDDDLYLDAAALNLHGFYSAVERVLVLIAREVDGVTPSGPDWHRELLRQMTVEVADLRPAALSPATALKLGDYLSFRHLVRQIYTFNLDPQRLRPLVEGLPELYRGVQSDLGAFVAFLDGIGHAG